MSFTDKGEKCEEHSDSEQNYQTEEEISDESFSDSIIKLKNICMKDDFQNSTTKKRISKNHFNRFNVSLRCGKSSRHFRKKNLFRKVKKTKKSDKKKKNCLEKPIETPKKGKRCRLGGKAKGKPPEEESLERRDSDDESDNSYFGRISLGYFQKFIDKSGASTSYQLDEDYKNVFPLPCSQQMEDKMSEETELMELQKWGMTGLVSSFNNKNQGLNTDDIQSDVL